MMFPIYIPHGVSSNSRMYSDKMGSWRHGIVASDLYKAGGKYGRMAVGDKTIQ